MIGFKRSGSGKRLCCSFCHKSQDEVAKLISDAYSRAYICDECVMVCNAILHDNQSHPAPSHPVEPKPPA